MNREEFFKWLYFRFQKSWASPEHFEAVKQDYKLVLSENTDFQKLHKITVEDHQDFFKPPAPAYFKRVLQELRNAEAQELKKYKPFTDGVPPTEEWLKLREKYGLK